MRQVLSRRHSHPPVSSRRPAAIFASFGTIAALASDSSSCSSYSPMEAPASINIPENLSPIPPPADQSDARRHRIITLPLTKANLESHTMCYSPRNDKRRYIESYVDAQAEILCIEANLQRDIGEEIRTLIPLDTPSPYDSVVHDDHGRVQRVLQQHQQWQQRPEGDDDSARALGNDNRKTWAPRNIFNTMKRRSKELESGERTVRPTSVSLMTAEAFEEAHQQYQLEKTTMIQHGLCGLSNANIARALAGADRSLATILFTPDALLSVGTPVHFPVSPSPSSAAVKRDSGISFFAALSTSKSIRGLSRRRHSKTSETTKEFSAVRYPKMVRLHALREHAIQVLTSQLSQSLCTCHSDQAIGRQQPLSQSA